MTPTKPLYCIRFTLVNTKAYTPAQILVAAKPGLEAAGAIVYQTPAIHVYTPKYSLSKEGPFEGDEEKSVFEKMTISGPSGVPIVVTRDMADPKGTRPVAEQRKAIVSAFAWNLGPPANTTPEQLGTILWGLLRKAFYDSKTFTGFGWGPLSSEWEQTLVKLPPYPDRPALPKVLTPVAAPKPIAPKPIAVKVGEAVITYPTPTVDMPDPIVSLTPSRKPTPAWLLPALGGLGLLGLLTAINEDRK